MCSTLLTAYFGPFDCVAQDERMNSDITAISFMLFLISFCNHSYALPLLRCFSWMVEQKYQPQPSALTVSGNPESFSPGPFHQSQGTFQGTSALLHPFYLIRSSCYFPSFQSKDFPDMEFLQSIHRDSVHSTVNLSG